MPARAAKPIQVLTEEHKRARRIFARLMGGESMRAIATSENLSLRRVQQIVREQLDRRNANPADDFALLQIARLERALDLIGGQIDAAREALRSGGPKRPRKRCVSLGEMKPGWKRAFGKRKKLRESAVKLLKSLARITSCAGFRVPKPRF